MNSLIEEKERVKQKIDKLVLRTGLTFSDFCDKNNLSKPFYFNLKNGRIKFSEDSKTKIQIAFSRYGVFFDVFDIWPSDNEVVPYSMMGEGSHTDTAVEIVLKKERLDGFREIYESLSDRQMCVIYERFYESKTLEKIAKKHNCTRERIRQIEQGALRKIYSGIMKYESKHEIIDLKKSLERDGFSIEEKLNWKEINSRRDVAIEKYYKAKAIKEKKEYIYGTHIPYEEINRKYDYTPEGRKSEKPKKLSKSFLKELYRHWPETNKHLKKMFPNVKPYSEEINK